MRTMSAGAALLALLLFIPVKDPALASPGGSPSPNSAAQTLPVAAARVNEFPIPYPHRAQRGAHNDAHGGSTHELAFDPRSGDLWLTGQLDDAVVRLTPSGQLTFYPMPTGSGPHGIAFDAAGQLWVSLEFSGEVVRLDAQGRVSARYDVHLACAGCAAPLNPHPHGLAVGPDGKTIWFTGKATGTVGRITPDGQVRTFPLGTVGSVPIYIEAGPDGNLWVTELVGNAIARVTPTGQVREFPIPTTGSRPIAIVPAPGGDAMWFSEEAGNRVARIAPDGRITEYPLPKTQNNVILAGLAFDARGDLWVQQYVDENNASPAGADHLIRMDRRLLTAPPGDLSDVPLTYVAVPTRQTVMHRVIRGPDGTLWFTELLADRVGHLTP